MHAELAALICSVCAVHLPFLSSLALSISAGVAFLRRSSSCVFQTSPTRYPLTRNFYESNSLRFIFFAIFEGSCALESPGKKDFCKELRMRFVIFRKWLCKNSFFVSNDCVSESNRFLKICLRNYCCDPGHHLQKCPGAGKCPKELGTSPPLTRVSRALRAPEMPKKSRKCLPGLRPGDPEKVSKKSGKSPKALSRHFPETLRRLPRLSPDFLETFSGSPGRRPWFFGHPARSAPKECSEKCFFVCGRPLLLFLGRGPKLGILRASLHVLCAYFFRSWIASRCACHSFCCPPETTCPIRDRKHHDSRTMEMIPALPWLCV